MQKADRLQALAAVRRAERARALEKLGSAEQDAEQARAACVTNQNRASALRAMLDAPLSHGRRGAEAVAAVMSLRRQHASELALLDTELSALRGRLAEAERVLSAAQDDAARAHNALKAVENRCL